MSDRGLSVAVNYVLSLAIATMLLSGLLFTVGDVVTDRKDAAVRGELEVLGERVAAGLHTADRLTQSGATTVTVGVELPPRVAGADYRVRLNASGERVELETVDESVLVTTPLRNETAMSESVTDGGDLEIGQTAGGDLEVRGG